METFSFTSADIAAVTFGHVTLKMLNNWADQDLWFSELAPVSRGRARRFSRLNLIEAALVHDLMVAGATRRDAKEYILLMAAKGQSGGYRADLPGHLEQRPAFSAGSSGWLWLLTFTENEGERYLDEFQEIKAEALPEKLSGNQHAAVVIPVSAIVARVDALRAEE